MQNSSKSWFGGLICVLWLAGCGSDGGSGTQDDEQSPPPPVPTPVLQTIVVTPAAGSVTTGQDLQFTATGSYSDGHSENITNSVTWTSSVTEVATINAQGVVIGGAQGQTAIRAAAGQISGQTSLSVLTPSTWSYALFSPDNGARVGDPFRVRIDLLSAPGEVTTVVATIGGTSTNLVFDDSPTGCARPCWLADVPVPPGFEAHHQLVVRATDALGNTTAFAREVIRDQRPVVHVTSPVAFDIARPELTLNATCADDDPAGCVLLEAAVCGVIGGAMGDCSAGLVFGTASINTTVNLQAFDGKAAHLQYRARDSGGQETTALIPIYIEATQRLGLIEEVPGLILDADAARILYLDTTEIVYLHTKTDKTLVLRDRATDVDTVIDAINAGVEFHYGFLTSTGVAYVLRFPAAIWNTGTSWESGTSIDLGRVTELVAEGSYVLWHDESLLWRRNLSTAANQLVSSKALNTENDIAANGTVAFTQSDFVYNIATLAANGTTPTPITSDTTFQNTYPRTDGTSVVYRKHPGFVNVPYRLMLHRNGVEQELLGPTDDELLPDRGYQIAGGWIAHLVDGPTGISQVRRLNPQEQATTLSAFGTDSVLELLASDGTLTFLAGKRRYLAPPSATAPTGLVDIGSDLGMTIIIGGVPHVAIGGSLFQVQ